MIKRYLVLLLICMIQAVGSAQVDDSLYSEFKKTNSYKTAKFFLEKRGSFHTDVSTDGTKSYSIITFINVVNNQKYVECETGIWKIGVQSSEPQYYLFFKYCGKYYFEGPVYKKVMKRFNHFCKSLKLSEKDSILYLFGIVKYLNECYGYPIECIVEDCYMPPVN